MSDAVVNKTRTEHPQPGIGHNQPPPDIYVREIKKLTAIEAVLKNPKFNQTQALILIGLIVRSDEMYQNAFPGAKTLALYAKVNRTQTVFDALKKLETELGVIKRQSRGEGRSNSYSVIPQRVMDDIVEAHEKRKVATTDSKPSAPTAPGRSPHQDAERTPTRYAERTTYPVIDPVDKKGGRRAPAQASYWQNALNPSSDVLYEAGRLTLFNGTRVHWLERFDGDTERLDLALTQAAGFIQANGSHSLETQVNSQLARIAGQKRDSDKRHAAVVASKPKGELPAWKADIKEKNARMRAAIERLK